VVQTAQLAIRPVAFAEACRRRFGETFTVRTFGFGEMVVISDPPSLKRLFSADRVNTLSPDRPALVQPVAGPRSLLVLDGEDHRRRRKLMLPPFHGERLRAYEGVMEEATVREVEGWPVGRDFPLHPGMQRITFEVILRAVFGIEAADRREELGGQLSEMLAFSKHTSLLGLVARRVQRLFGHRPDTPLLEASDAILAALIAERRADPELPRRQDILSMLLTARFEDGSAMDDEDLRDQLMTLLIAGHETTATGLAWAFDLLLHAPEKLERLVAELSAGDGHAYLDAVIAETLRLRPVVPTIGRTLGQPAELGGWGLPAGTIVIPSLYLIHTRQDLFPDPLSFRPERFLDQRPETYSWVPFGGGARRCIGAAFAQLEMAVALRTILTRVRLAPASDRPERLVRRNITLSPRNGSRAIVRERL